MITTCGTSAGDMLETCSARTTGYVSVARPGNCDARLAISRFGSLHKLAEDLSGPVNVISLARFNGP